ncbi:MAG: hypothetical protein DWQ47_11235 [Acidobacteria bacterium]|nr:MAG: hypothetical protein DWQ32_13650 [Acidobacteriota bacterium]REJ98151.1 MAG: hypothetical protein DWQ38_16450 [Acidobacteriota bacterium]REK16894.1 MAG: hypothetical protein DWQ43_01495 [Acidobacteriota bacterium]REK42805.1 MAG: hypothetical protein DWQ47_11235 [Acidobacteriota bacterium]
MDKARSAELLIQLYDLRRETVMREARNWMGTFFVDNAEDFAAAMMDPETGGYLRMVISYWDMAASFVEHGAIDRQMFYDANGEFLFVFCKIRPHLEGIREMFDMPEWMQNLENLVMAMPNAEKNIEKMEGWMKESQEQMSQMAEGQAG